MKNNLYTTLHIFLSIIVQFDYSVVFLPEPPFVNVFLSAFRLHLKQVLILDFVTSP